MLLLNREYSLYRELYFVFYCDIVFLFTGRYVVTKEELLKLKEEISKLSEEERREVFSIKRLPSVEKPWLKKYAVDISNKTVPQETIYRYFMDSTKLFSDLSALNYFGLDISYDSLKRKIDDCAKALLNLNVKKGEIVTIVSPTMPEAIYLLYALNKIGAIANFIHPLSSPSDFKYLINEVDTRILIAYNGCLKNINEIINETSVEKIITVSPMNSMPILTKTGLKMYSVLMQKQKFDLDDKYEDWSTFIRNGKTIKIIMENEYQSNYPAVITHTSGSTGVPKGVVLTNDNFNAMVEQYKIVATNFRVGDSMLTAMPPFASFGLCNCMHMPICLGVKVILVPKYDSKDSYKYFSKYHFNHMMGIPQYFIDMAHDKKYSKKRLFNFGYLCIGGAGIDESDEKYINNDFLKEHGGTVKITKGYGMSEVTSSGSFTFENSNAIGSVGTVLPFTNAKVIDLTTQKELSYYEEGQICFSGATVMKEYYKNDKATKDVFLIDSDGTKWVKTGDLGYIDKDGIIFVTGRIKRVILTMAEDKSLNKVNPDKIEEVIKELPFVEACTVIGVKHEKRLAVPKCYITLREGYDVDMEDIIMKIDKLCIQRLRESLLPYEYVILSKMPRTAIGKIKFEDLEKEEGLDIKYLKKVRI